MLDTGQKVNASRPEAGFPITERWWTFSALSGNLLVYYGTEDSVIFFSSICEWSRLFAARV